MFNQIEELERRRLGALDAVCKWRTMEFTMRQEGQPAHAIALIRNEVAQHLLHVEEELARWRAMAASKCLLPRSLQAMLGVGEYSQVGPKVGR